jgi:hypothetical protein
MPILFRWVLRYTELNRQHHDRDFRSGTIKRFNSPSDHAKAKQSGWIPTNSDLNSLATEPASLVCLKYLLKRIGDNLWPPKML